MAWLGPSATSMQRANTPLWEQRDRRDVPQTVVYTATVAKRRAWYGATAAGSARQMPQCDAMRRGWRSRWMSFKRAAKGSQRSISCVAAGDVNTGPGAPTAKAGRTRLNGAWSAAWAQRISR